MEPVYQELIREVRLLPSTALFKQERNTSYLMELSTRNLLFAYHNEAGLAGWLNHPVLDTHGGWDGPLSHIRGTFTGHWLSAAARTWQATANAELKGKADHIVAEIARCQEANGGEWAFSIPEKYLHGIKKGQSFWAPQYVCHKTMMGLLDMYEFAGNGQALDIIKKCATWFLRFTDDISRETMDQMMNVQETGGIMEFWADLYAVTGDENHLELMRRYERPQLYNPLLAGVDALTNMHANTTLPEIHGCARAYEVTGEERYRAITEAYWDFAVDRRGAFATGGQTDAEIYSPMQMQAGRLSDLNQEHCTVYNLIRLANYLYRWTGEAKYADYIEQNIHNGIFAQGHWHGRTIDSAGDAVAPPETGLVAYFLPLDAGSRKFWGSKTRHFWCCHCTLVQAHTRLREFIYYQNKNELTIAQYMPSTAQVQLAGTQVEISQAQTNLSGESLEIVEAARKYPARPHFSGFDIKIKADKATAFTLRLRLPWWLKGKAEIQINGQDAPYETINGYAVLHREWQDDTLTITLPKGLTCWPLADRPNTVAFLDGPVLLAGLIDEERTLYGDINEPATMLASAHEREWTTWTSWYKTINQPVNFKLKPLNEIGHETYTVYFPVQMPKP